MHKLLHFKDQKLLIQALTHRSYINEHPEAKEHNERLEFLGDALLTFLCGEYLYKCFPPIEEDEMTRRRSALVDEKQLARFAEDIGLTFKMRLSTGAIREGGYQNPNLLSSTFEAIVAAYYIDNNYDIDSLRSCIIPLFESISQERMEHRASIDAKNRLQAIFQEKNMALPKYKTERSGGPDHAPEFLSIVYIGGKQYGQGKGHSKKEAEKKAAENALSKLDPRQH